MPPTTSIEVTASTTAMTSGIVLDAPSPMKNRYGMTTTDAPMAKATKLERAALRGDPSSSGSRPSSSRARVSRAVLGSDMIWAARDAAVARSTPFAR